jgi:retinol dehydrogenase 12
MFVTWIAIMKLLLLLIFDLEGGTFGIGAETTRVLAKRGVRIVIGARDLKKAMKVRDNIQK